MSGENRCAQPAIDWCCFSWSAGRPRPTISNLRQRLNRKRVRKRPSCRLEGEAPEGFAFHSRTPAAAVPVLADGPHRARLYAQGQKATAADVHALTSSRGPIIVMVMQAE
jgi:hypothetical protein